MMGRRLGGSWLDGAAADFGNGGCVELRCVALLECRRAGEPSVQVCRFLFCSVGTVSFHLPIQPSAGRIGARQKKKNRKQSVFLFLYMYIFLSYFILVLANSFNNELLLSRQEGVDQLSANFFGSFGARHAYIHISLPTEYY